MKTLVSAVVLLVTATAFAAPPPPSHKRQQAKKLTGPFASMIGEDIVPIVYPNWDRKTLRTGATGSSGPENADMVDAATVTISGHPHLLALISHWEGDAERAQASGPTPCLAALIEKQGKNFNVVAKGEVPGGSCSTAEVGPYEVDQRTPLLGVDSSWMNHGIGWEAFTLFAVEGDKMHEVFHEQIASQDSPDADMDSATVVVDPSASGPSVLKVIKAGDKSNPATVQTWTWNGKKFVKGDKGVAILAKAEWQATGATAKQGQTVEVQAAGFWKVAPNAEPAGPEGSDHGTFLDYRVYKGEKTKLGAFICHQASSDKTYAGAQMKFIADKDGPVLCRINDSDFANNSGSMVVTAKVR